MFIYSAFDRPEAAPLYSAEAYVSARSLRRHTDRPIRLLTNNEPFIGGLSRRADFPFTDVSPLTGDEIPKAFKIRSIGAAAGDCVFLDTDTIVLADLSRVFEFGPFDLAAVPIWTRDHIVTMDQAVRREARRRHALNSGVLFIRDGFAAPLSKAWLGMFHDAVAREGPAVFDQPALVRALRTLEPNLMPLPHNYNYRSQFGGFVSGAVFVVHSHYRRDLARLIRGGLDDRAVDRLIDHAATINATTGEAVMPALPSSSLMRANLRRPVAGRPRLARLLGRRRG